MFTVNQIVMFGRPNGEKTFGKVISVNQKTVTVEQLQARGVQKEHNIGKKWAVSFSMVTVPNQEQLKAFQKGETIPASTTVTPTAVPTRTFDHRIKVGEKVRFGSPHSGETLGLVKKVNPTSFRVEQLEPRGGHVVGTMWNVRGNVVWVPSNTRPRTPEEIEFQAEMRAELEFERRS